MRSKTRFLFKVPIKSDWAFWLWISISGLATLSTFASNLSNGKLGASNNFQVVSGTIDAAFALFGNFLIWYVISLLWLVPRKLVSNKNFNLEGTDEPLSENPDPQDVIESIQGEKSISALKLSQTPIRVAITLLALFLFDQGARNFELNNLVTRIHNSESQMENRNAEVTKAYDRFAEGYATHDATELQVANAARKYAPLIAAHGSEVEGVYVFPWHPSINRAKRAFMNHNNAWVKYLGDTAVIDGRFENEQLGQEVSVSFEILRFSLPKAAPILDFFSLNEKIADIIRD